MTQHKIIFGDCRNMKELSDGSVHLMVTSPPYYNAPFDFPGLFRNYEDFLQLISDAAKEIYRVLATGRIAAVVTDDMLIDGVKYPILADVVTRFLKAGFKYRDKIIWRKPEGYIRISRRSGVVVQKPYPMYFYPDNIKEEILLFQKGRFDYQSITEEVKENSKIEIGEFLGDKWYLSVWDMTNVLPSQSKDTFAAAFPDALARRLIKLFSFKGETVLDPFLGSGTTTKIARMLARNSVGYELDVELLDVIKERTKADQFPLGEQDTFEFVIRDDAQRLRTDTRERIRQKIAQRHR
ncbi:MAG: site-specific DNA-methyltransferase [Dehalococcoidia bacterium]|nr:site-specific DNA-methyltransferase [Dehalococcoidia bacterium]